MVRPVNQKVSEFDEITSVSDDDYLPIVVAGTTPRTARVKKSNLATSSLVQTATGVVLPAQSKTQYKGAYLNPDSANSRNTADYDRVDIREYGANMGGIQRTTATGTAGSAAVTLANAKNYRDGNWLMLSGLGAAHGMATPAAPILAVQGTTGGATVSVKVIALTSTGGYTAASTATTVTTANATLSETNFVEVWCANVPSAYRYIVYVQFGGSGNYPYFGGVIAHQQFDSIGRVEALTFRITSSTPPTAPAWLPSTAPATGQANGLRTQIISGGGTTAITVSPIPVTSGAGVNCDVCNVIPIEDAINVEVGYSTEIRIPRGETQGAAAYCTGPLQIRSPIQMRGSNGGSVQAASRIKFRDGCGISTYNTKGADQWQPGTHYRIGDRVVSQLRTGVVGCWKLTSISGGAAWGVSGTTEPVWNYAGTTPDNGHTWTFDVADSSASGAEFKNIRFEWEGRTIPANRIVLEDDLRTGVTMLAGNGAAPNTWAAGITPAHGSYYVPPDSGVTGKIYQATAVSGPTAGVPPVWPRVHGATVVDNGNVTWTCVDVRRVQGAGVYVNTVTNMHSVSIDGPGGTGLVCDGNSYSNGGATSDSRFRKMDIRNCSGHLVATYGSDGQVSSFSDIRLGPKIAGGGSCAIQDDSLYGNTYTNIKHNGGARYQNQPWTNVQRNGKLSNCYVEGGVGGETDWSGPAIVDTGHHAAGFRTECLARLVSYGISVNPAIPSQCLNTNPVNHDPTGITVTQQFAGGSERKYFGTGTVAAATLLQEHHQEQLARGRTQRTARGSSQVVEEVAHFDARGVGLVIPSLRVGSGPDTLSECRFEPRFAIPTKGVFAPGDWYSWNDTSARLGFKVRRWGGLGATARANSTAYVQDDVISTGGLHFVCVAAGTSASSLPAAYAATTTAGDAVTDGTAVFRRWFTAQDPQLMAIPNPWDEMTAVTDADQTIQIKTSSLGTACRDMPAATANRIITLGTSGIMPGDCWYLRQLNNVAFTITINTVDGGSVVMPASTKCWVIIRRTVAGTYTQHSAGILL